MDISNLINWIPVVEEKRKYYFVRTDSGVNFEVFLQGGFIGIGWNPISIEDMTKLMPSQVKEKIASKTVDGGIDLSTSKGKSTATAIYNKLKHFMDLKKGDMVIIPSYGSSRLAFGIVADEYVYSEVNDLGDCNYTKRRKVDWQEVKSIYELDPIFYKIKTTQHSISSVGKYADYIDFVTNTIYIKKDSGHFVLDVKTTDEINISDLLDLLQSFQSISSAINEKFNLGESVEKNSVRLNIQSPGTVALKLGVGVTAVLGLAFTIYNFPNSNTTMPNNQRQEILKVIEENRQDFDSLNQTMQKLKIPKDKMSTFK